MALRVISIAQSTDPLAYEREDHRARALAAMLANIFKIIEKDETGLTNLLNSGVFSLQVRALGEPRLLFVDPAGDEQGYHSKWKTGHEESSNGSGESDKEESRRPELSRSPQNKKASRFGERSSGVGQSQTAHRGEKLGQVSVNKEGQEAEEMNAAHLPEDELDPEFYFGDDVGSRTTDGSHEDIVFEEKIQIERLLDMMAEQFHLPLMRTTNIGLLKVRMKGRPYGVRMRGPQSQLHKRKTSEKRIERVGDGDDGFIEEDLRYIRHESSEEYKSNAVVIFVRDASGSTRKDEIVNLIRAFCLHTLRAIRAEHDLVDLVFITFDLEAKRHTGEKAEWEFFHRYSRGGTLISSGLNMARDILEKEYFGVEWNRFVFVLSDGEKQDKEIDNPAILSSAITALAAVTDILGYFEIGCIGLTYPDFDSSTGIINGSLIRIDSDGTIRNQATNMPTGSFTAIKEFLDVASRGQSNIVAVRLGDDKDAGKAFVALIDFCEKRRKDYE